MVGRVDDFFGTAVGADESLQDDDIDRYQFQSLVNTLESIVVAEGRNRNQNLNGSYQQTCPK